MFYIDWTYIVLVMPAIVFSVWASSKVNSTFQKYSKQYAKSNMTGYDAARMILDANGLKNVNIEKTSGNLTDHYDPKSNIVRLSDAVYSGTSTAAIGVAAHECGHAIQHMVGYFPVKIRTAIVPITNIGSRLSIPLIMIGIIFSYTSIFFSYLAYFGLACFALSTVFQLVTLPTEYNASSRAINILTDCGKLSQEEIYGAKKVLNAAALTYVAALAVSLTQLLRLFLLVSGGRRRR